MFSPDNKQLLDNILKTSNIKKYFFEPNLEPQHLLTLVETILNCIFKNELYSYSNNFLNSLDDNIKENVLKELQEYYFDLIIVAFSQYSELEKIRFNTKNNLLIENGESF